MPGEMQLSKDEVRLLEFSTYEDYLQSLVTTQDLRYLGHKQNGLRLYQTGYRSLTKAAFESRRNEIGDYFRATQDPNAYFSRGLVTSDAFLRELAVRERPNRLGMLSTIIFVRHCRKNAEISGYIDYEQALRRSSSKDNPFDWKTFFAGEQVLCPTRFDLSYYNSRTNKVFKRDSKNYQVLCDPVRGIIFRNMYDRKNIYPDPIGGHFGTNTTRMEVEAAGYEQIVLYDHVVRKNY
ncbi:cilia- and flagella-associated protein 299-like [Culex pipiens pallens]|uniref:cilia- and flagella-associated protein 299-like n=1 Tax=Culex pipiens pallens TaxID=42434 RepID=UPI0019530A96|nr:cilia- and flagella-associated protein 299-like [Culex pipiens pallens]